jgi:hypothetical protein
MLETMPNRGEWTVYVYRWTWTYVFFTSGTVTWTDIDGHSGLGTWKTEKHKVIIHWAKSSAVAMGWNDTTWEEWNLPIDVGFETGTVHTKTGEFDLRAEGNNFLDPDVKSKFLEQCNAATNKIQVAQFKFSAWLSGISVAYSDAYDAHNKVINDIAALQKLVEDMLLDAALRFLTGGVGGRIGAAMKKAKKSDFMVDAIKDLGKYGVSGPASAALKSSGKVVGMPPSPSKWQNLVNERVSTEMSEVSSKILKWRSAVAPEIITIDVAFDPADVVEKALTIKTSLGDLSLMTLKEVDKPSLQRDFEKGFLVAWIELGAVSKVPALRDLALDKLRAYGLRLGLTNINQLLDKYIPVYRPVFSPGSLTP